MTEENVSGGLWQEGFTVSFTVVSQQLPGSTKENHKKAILG
jgi:hypothetical protein